MLKKMMEWFKQEFFQWVDQPACDHCGVGDDSYSTLNVYDHYDDISLEQNCVSQYGNTPSRGKTVWWI
jgi:hypothetical protein